MSEQITASMIIEVIGKPPEHLLETLENISNKINLEKGVKVISKKIHETKEIEKAKGFYSTFMEIEVKFDSLEDLIKIVLFYMPAHIEILEPEKIKLDNNSLKDILNAVTNKLHLYDETARILQSREIKMQKRLKELEEKK